MLASFRFFVKRLWWRLPGILGPLFYRCLECGEWLRKDPKAKHPEVELEYRCSRCGAGWWIA